MSITRRDFMKLFGVGVASLLMTRCKPVTPPPIPSCYTSAPPLPEDLAPRDRLRKCWLSFGELVQKTIEEANQGNLDMTFGQELIAEHREAVEIETIPSIAALVQEAYEAAVYHVWRSNISVACYEPMMVDYAPASAEVLVQQAKILDEITSQSDIDAETLAKVKAALEHDMAFYAMSEAEVAFLYDRILAEWQAQNEAIPDFQNIDLEVTPTAKAAAHFIIELLTGQ
jgi:hypothetical protein